MTLLNYGIGTPSALLGLVIVLTLTGAVCNRATLKLLTLASCAGISTIFYLHRSNIFPLTTTWDNQSYSLGDVIVFCASLLGITTLLLQLSKTTNQALLDSIAANAALESERDSLEATVKQRTEEIRQIQLKHSIELHHLAEIGKQSAGILHDLSSPLGAITLDLHSAKETTDSPNLARAIQAVEKMNSSVKSIRKQVSVDSSESIFPPHEELEQIIAMCTYRLRLKQAKVVTELDTTIVLKMGQPTFHRCALNLITNAIDALPANKHNNTVWIKTEITPEREFLLTVTDNGSGIDPAHHNQIFTPFFTTKPLEQGSGMGLSICQDFFEKAGGALRLVTSGHGLTIFQGRLPQSTIQNREQNHEQESSKTDSEEYSQMPSSGT